MKKSKDKKPTFELWEVIVIAIVSSIIMSLGTGYIAFRNNSLANVTNNKRSIFFNLINFSASCFLKTNPMYIYLLNQAK